jgi:hypothetical protein
MEGAGTVVHARRGQDWGGDMHGVYSGIEEGTCMEGTFPELLSFFPPRDNPKRQRMSS